MKIGEPDDVDRGQQDTAARDEARAHWKAIEQIDADYPHALYLRVISPQSSNIDLPLGEE